MVKTAHQEVHRLVVFHPVFGSFYTDTPQE